MSSFQPIFHTNCSLPEQPTHVISTPNVRGTLDILWNALSALLLCTWSIQHLNVPAQRIAATFREKLSNIRVSLFRKLFWMAVTLVAPELLVGAALSDRVSAHIFKNEMKKWEDDGSEWTLTHAFYANMGGFVLDFSDEITPSQTVLLSAQLPEENHRLSNGLLRAQANHSSPNSQVNTSFSHHHGKALSTRNTSESPHQDSSIDVQGDQINEVNLS